MVMKLVALLLLVSCASARVHRQSNDKDVKDKQVYVNKLLSGLAGVPSYNHVHKDFPFADQKYYKNEKVVDKFVVAWEEGFIPMESTFNLYSYKNRHDTYRLFDLFYYAKDFPTFIKIAEWARAELNPLQFVYAFTTALYQRQDTQGIAIPHLHEVLPHYYNPSDIIQGTYKAYIKGVENRQFDVNTTGYEYSWYKQRTMDSYKTPSDWNEYDIESRMSYYTEDVDLADYITKVLIAYGPWINEQRYPEIHFEHRGLVLFDQYKFLLGKYNLERYANDLPPVQPINFNKPIETGYNPHLVTIHGHPMTSRPDHLEPLKTNPEGVYSFLDTKRRFDESIDFFGYWNPENQTLVQYDEDINGLDTFSQLIFGTHSQQRVRSLYDPFYYHAIQTLEQAVDASNNVARSGSVLGNYLTEMRDPVYYRVLATIYQTFQNFMAKYQPYTREQIVFPGVKVEDINVAKIQTYFENQEYDITYSVPFKSAGDGNRYSYSAVRTRLNHKPFDLKVTITSDKDQDALVKFFLAPAFDANNRDLSTAEKMDKANMFYLLHLKLKKGSHSYNIGMMKDYYTEADSFKTLKEKAKSGEAMYTTNFARCAFPGHLLLPKGSVNGKQFTFMTVVTPLTGDMPEDMGVCGWDGVYKSLNQLLNFPFDRRPVVSYIEQATNIHFKDMPIYHTDNYENSRHH